MNGGEIFLDTNICIYLLNGDQILSDFLQDQKVYISIITEIELYSFHGNTDGSIAVLDAFADSVAIVDINKEIKALTIALRKKYKLKIPDTIIAASALSLSMPFITADKGFQRIDSLDLILHENISR
ncbi:type II toxin-antitoxin system VapC family toxin [Mucilaginibacter paludis]|uniref:PilT protein domain protein n=1 Tax=Mucilaginibacter paludis DSM 18603 TaxID=714943 RepID=H1Y6R2_9SPHI|nr:type II toxin-antitoxin system VapC family toxin [Mucilaginibacter paludis]EHQ26854.1 PilT protein domain protein [Mucilaginibacter paludis DSM 18603]